VARLFAKASSQYLERTSAVVSAYPCTMVCWFKPTTSTATQTAISVGSSSAARYLALGLVTANTGFFECASTATADANGPAGTIADGAWGHLAGVATSATSRQCYVNGAVGTTDATNLAFPAVDRSHIGALMTSGTRASFADGAAAEAAMWNVALSAADILTLSLGVSPLLVRPASLVAYWPLRTGSSPEIELRARNELTLGAAGAAPTITDHVRVLIPPSRMWTPKTSVSGGAPVNISAVTGTASATGSSSTLSITLTAASGAAASATGGTSSLAASYTAASGTSTAAGGTSTLALTVTAASGTASAAGGTASLARTSTASTGTATATGTASSLSVSFTATGGTATAVGGDATASATGANVNVSATTGTATAAGSSVTLSRTHTVVSGAATAQGGTASSSFTFTASTGLASATGGTVNRTNLVTGGAATATGSPATVTFAYQATTGIATAQGQTATATVDQTVIRWDQGTSSRWPVSQSARWPVSDDDRWPPSQNPGRWPTATPVRWN
jgi:hypothetical protein